jgi:hypothetical protein
MPPIDVSELLGYEPLPLSQIAALTVSRDLHIAKPNHGEILQYLNGILPKIQKQETHDKAMGLINQALSKFGSDISCIVVDQDGCRGDLHMPSPAVLVVTLNEPLKVH